MFLVGGSQPSGPGEGRCQLFPVAAEARSYASYAPAQPGTEISGPPQRLVAVTRMSLLFNKIPGARNQKRYLQNLDLDIDCIVVS